MTAADETWMRRAIALAQTHVGKTGENPSVGCVIVKDAQVVGEGVTGVCGRPHAEEIALDQAGAQAEGATAYVTLEPCGERSSGAPACSTRLVAAKVARVIVATTDASVLAGGRGLQRLRDADIATEVGLLHGEAERLYTLYRPAK